MKKLAISLFIAIIFLGALSMHADQIDDDGITILKQGFGIDVLEYPTVCKAAKKAKQSVSTNVIAYQYTVDGWLQHVAVYADSVICTNAAGPREGLQLIIAGNGALIDMCHTYKQHTDYVSHKYTWGEVRTYQTHQTVTLN